MTREAILQSIQESLGDVNAERPAEERIEFSEDLALYGVGSPFDSLDFVNFTVGLEDRLRRDGLSIDLAAVLLDDTAENPFRSVAALATYLSSGLQP